MELVNPEEEVQVTLTREECMRVDACVSALVTLAEEMGGMGLATALGLGPSLPILKRVTEKLREFYPHDEMTETVHHIERMSSDTKTYSPEPTVTPVDHIVEVDPSTPVNDLDGITNVEAKGIFGTEYDESIKALHDSLIGYTNYTHEQFHDLLEQTKAVLTQVVHMPENLTVGESRPYVVVSDLVTLGQLAHEMYLRQDQVEEHVGKPF